MLDRTEEYIKMAEVERELWWYRILHNLVHSVLKTVFIDRNPAILDAGCGTGGLLLFLRERGYNKLRGFDLSEIAVEICQSQSLDVFQSDLCDLSDNFKQRSLDVIVSNDTLYHLTKLERRAFFDACGELLRPGGLVVCNTPAIKYFSGIHDQAVGVNYRFTRQDIPSVFDPEQYTILQQTYWPFFLSPVIFTIRAVQRLRLNMGLVKEIRSDIDLPVSWLNTALYKICSLENKITSNKPFGSSLFTVLQRRI
ncbi:MAG: class I SAM-dependent methyltransferase [Gammaproteobacteria bacterium]|nr:class I SAM-dependent methyltransferase [Gammaproteobacteria bacterium]